MLAAMWFGICCASKTIKTFTGKNRQNVSRFWKKSGVGLSRVLIGYRRCAPSCNKCRAASPRASSVYEILGKDLGREEGRLEERRKELAETQALAEQLEPEQQRLCYPRLDEFRRQVLPDTSLNLNNLDKSQRELRSFIQKQLENADGRLKRVSEKLIKQMQTYKTDYPAEAAEVDVSLEALDEYRSMLQALESEDLPRHEARFKQLLNEGTINSVALFQNQLERERRQIEEKDPRHQRVTGGDRIHSRYLYRADAG